MNEDLDGLVYEFFRMFARFEYALKATGYHRCNRRSAEPDWARFAESAPVRGLLNDPANAGLTAAINYILHYPPNKQVIENGALAWSNCLPDAGNQSGRVLTFVRRVRNNLFHGGKGNQHWFEPERTELLLRHSLTILHECLAVSQDVARAYHDGKQHA